MTDQTNFLSGDQWKGTAMEGWKPEQDQTVKGWGTQYDIAENKLRDGIDKSVGGFAAVRAPAWHNLGVTFDHPVDADTLLKAAGADYDVHLEESAAIRRDPAGNVIEIIVDPKQRKTCRIHPVTGEHNLLGNVSPTYPVFQNRESFVGFGDAILKEGRAAAATCGVLWEGRQAFMCWKLPKGLLVGGEDAAELWLLVHTSHDGSRPLTCAVTPLRTVCQNTCRYNLGNAVTRWTIKHTANAKLAVQQARESLQMTWDYVDEWQAVADKLLLTACTDAQFEKIITEEWGPGEDPSAKAQKGWDDRRAKLLHLFKEADTQANIRNTMWGAVQAVGEYVDWNTKVQVKTDGIGGEDGYRFWRSLDDEKTVAGPKKIIIARARQYAGV